MCARRKLVIIAGAVKAVLWSTAEAYAAQSTGPSVVPGSSIHQDVSGPTEGDMSTVPQSSVTSGGSAPQQVVMPGPFGGVSPQESAARKAAAAKNPNAPHGTDPQGSAPSEPTSGSIDSTSMSTPAQGSDDGSDAPVTGVVQGVLQLGPVSPVQIDSTYSPPPPEVCVAQSVIVQPPDQQIDVERTTLQPDCSYQLSLEPGTYIVQLETSGVSGNNRLSQTVQVESNQTVEVDFAVDTGLR